MILGCTSSSNNSPPTLTTGQGNDKLAQVFADCEKGESGLLVACETILSSDISELFSKSSLECLRVSESAFVNTSRSQQYEIQNDTIKTAERLKMIAFFCLEQGDLAKKKADGSRASKLYQKAADIGRELSSPNRQLIFQKLGDFITKNAQEKIKNQSGRTEL